MTDAEKLAQSQKAYQQIYEAYRAPEPFMLEWEMRKLEAFLVRVEELIERQNAAVQRPKIEAWEKKRGI